MADDRNALREKLRAEAPEMAAFVDSCRRVFGEIKITYLKIGDVEFGSKSTRPAVHPTDSTPVAEVMAKWNADNIKRRAAGGRAK